MSFVGITLFVLVPSMLDTKLYTDLPPTYPHPLADTHWRDGCRVGQDNRFGHHQGRASRRDTALIHLSSPSCTVSQSLDGSGCSLYAIVVLCSRLSVLPYPSLQSPFPSAISDGARTLMSDGFEHGAAIYNSTTRKYEKRGELIHASTRRLIPRFYCADKLERLVIDLKRCRQQHQLPYKVSRSTQRDSAPCLSAGQSIGCTRAIDPYDPQ